MEENNKQILMELDVQMDAGILYDYMIYHTYHGPSGILGTLIGFLMIGYYFGYHASVIYLIFGVIVMFYLPVTLFTASRRQMLATPAFKEPLHYTFTEEGIEVSQNDASEGMKWEDMRKAVSTAKSIILYTSKVNATIIPRKVCRERGADLIQIIATHMPPKKVKIRQ